MPFVRFSGGQYTSRLFLKKSFFATFEKQLLVPLLKAKKRYKAFSQQKNPAGTGRKAAFVPLFDFGTPKRGTRRKTRNRCAARNTARGVKIYVPFYRKGQKKWYAVKPYSRKGLTDVVPFVPLFLRKYIVESVLIHLSVLLPGGDRSSKKRGTNGTSKNRNFFAFFRFRRVLEAPRGRSPFPSPARITRRGRLTYLLRR